MNPFPYSIGTHPFPIPVHISEPTQALLNHDLDILRNELEVANPGCIKDFTSTKNPLIPVRYNRKPLAGQNPNHSVQFTLQVVAHNLVFKTSLLHPFVKDFHAHTRDSDNEEYKHLVYNVYPPSYQDTTETMVLFTQPITNVRTRVRCSYVINGMDKQMHFHAHTAGELASFLDLFLSLYEFARTVNQKILFPDPEDPVFPLDRFGNNA
jgi:hypothetical protein